MKLYNLYPYHDIYKPLPSLPTYQSFSVNNTNIIDLGFTPHRDSSFSSTYRVVGKELVIDNGGLGLSSIRLPILPLQGILSTVESIKLDYRTISANSGFGNIKLAFEMFYPTSSITANSERAYTTLYHVLSPSDIDKNMLAHDIRYTTTSNIQLPLATNDRFNAGTEMYTYAVDSSIKVKTYDGTINPKRDDLINLLYSIVCRQTTAEYFVERVKRLELFDGFYIGNDLSSNTTSRTVIGVSSIKIKYRGMLEKVYTFQE